MNIYRNGKPVVQCDACWKIVTNAEEGFVQGRARHCCTECLTNRERRTKAFAPVSVVEPEVKA